MISKRELGRCVGLVLPVLLVGSLARGYVDLAPSLPKIIKDAPIIALVEVTDYDRVKHVVTFKPVRTLKGKMGTEPFTQEVAPEGGTVPRQIVQWAVPGSRAVVFQSGAVAKGTALVSFGTGWYQVNNTSGGPWKLGKERPDLPLAYYGSLPRLAESVQALLKGEGTIITAVAYGVDGAASFDLALNRQSLPGVIKLQRIRAAAGMTGSTFALTGAFIGMGVVDERDLPMLMEQLQSADAEKRAEAVEELRTLDRKAKGAEGRLVELLGDASPRVRFAAASALLRVTKGNSKAVALLLAGLGDRDLVVRHFAVEAAGYCGGAGGALAEKLAGLLKDSDEGIRLTALESISMLGSVAGKAVPALLPLLEDKDLQVDAADALGRIGPAGKPALKKLTEMLSSEVPAVRWAAVRGMSQIGGEEAHPAVEFMIKAIPGATEVEGYNMMIYFAMLGPVAKDAIPAIQGFNLKNPMLPNATQWAINQNRFPWDYAGAPVGVAKSASAFASAAGFSGPNEVHFAAFVRELGPRLGGMSGVLAKALIEKKAGSPPVWGYELLNAAPEKALAVLVPALKDGEVAVRERAAVAIGYMGERAAGAKGEVEMAMGKAGSERERNLMKWAAGKVEGE